MLDLSEMRGWPERDGATGSTHEEGPAREAEYAELSVAHLAERCAHAVTEWGTEKIAAVSAPLVLWKEPAAHPLVLALLLLDRYGAESFEWDPEVLRATTLRDGLQISGSNWTKVLAVHTLLSSPSPWRQWEVFHWVARGLAGLPPNFSFLEEPELGHLMVCADVMAVCDPARRTTEEVDKYVAAALRHEGHVWAPESLSFAQRALEDPKLECAKCGAIFPDDNDAKCITCGASMLKQVPFAFAVLRDECAGLFTPRRTFALEHFVDGLPESPAGNLVYELGVQWSHALHVRKQLLAQLRALAK